MLTKGITKVLVAIGLLLVVLLSVQVFSMRSVLATDSENALSLKSLSGSDYYQRHRDEFRIARPMDTTDYFHRHPEVRVPVTGALDVADSINQASSDAQRTSDTTDYFQRHSLAVTPLDLTGSDYFQRHPEFTAPPREVDMTDYYFRHPSLPSK